MSNQLHDGDETDKRMVDAMVYVWQRENGNLVETLPGHSGSINCVAWNPKNPHMFASAGDDRLVRMYAMFLTPGVDVC